MCQEGIRRCREEQKEGNANGYVYHTIARINEEEKTCTLNFGSTQLGFKRYDVPLSELRPVPEGSQSYAT